MIVSEDDVDNVGCACDVCRQGRAAVLLHQGCPIPIHDFDKVKTGRWITTQYTQMNSKVGELQPQNLPALHLYSVRLLKVVRVVVRVVW